MLNENALMENRLIIRFWDGRENDTGLSHLEIVCPMERKCTR